MKSWVYDIPLAEYVSDPAPEPSLSASIAHVMLDESPLHAWHNHPRLNPHYQPNNADKFDIGTIAHNVLLEGDYSRIAVVNEKDWRKDSAKDARDEARAAGKVPILSKDMEAIEAMVTAAKEAIACSELSECFTTDGGKSEQTLIWEEQGIWLRSRPDRRSTDWRVIVDYKTTGTNAKPELWAKGPLLNNGYDIQAALGLRGVNKLQLSDRCTFIFIVQEINPPYAVSFVRLSPSYRYCAELKLDRAIALWRRCMETCNWPSYGSQTVDVEPPPWAFNGCESDIEWSQA